MKVCVGLVICELACDRKAHGPEGEELGKTLEKFQTGAPGVNPARLEYYTNASSIGEESQRGGAGCPGKCPQAYSACKQPAEELIQFANKLKISENK